MLSAVKWKALVASSLTLCSHPNALQLIRPTGGYGVGASQHIVPHITSNDPTSPNGTNTFLLATIYYPTGPSSNVSSISSLYFDPISSQIWGDALGYPNGTLQSLRTSLQWNAARLTASTELPTVVFSPGGGVNAFMYYVLTADLASKGYTVVLIDHPGEAPYLQLPGGDGITGLSIYTEFNDTISQRIYEFRVADISATLSWFEDYVSTESLPWNTSAYITIGHSVGGAAAAGAMVSHPGQIVGAINLDGAFWQPVLDVKGPFLIMTSINHTAQSDSTLSNFVGKQSGWWEWLSVYGSAHLDYSDISVWPDILGLQGKTGTPQIGSIGGMRMMEIVRAYVGAFLNFVTEGKNGVLQRPSLKWREVVYISDGWSGGVSQQKL